MSSALPMAKKLRHEIAHRSEPVSLGPISGLRIPRIMMQNPFQRYSTLDPEILEPSVLANASAHWQKSFQQVVSRMNSISLHPRGGLTSLIRVLMTGLSQFLLGPLLTLRDLAVNLSVPFREKRELRAAQAGERDTSQEVKARRIVPLELRVLFQLPVFRSLVDVLLLEVEFG